MQVTKNITLDLLETGSPVIIKAKQNDRNTRYISAHLYVDGLAYPVPNGTEIAFRYKKPDGTAGFYDALPDNSPAITVSGNTVTVELVEQVLTVAGCVHCEINMYNAASEKLTTFTFEISVEESVLTDAEIISSDYYNVLTAEIAKALQAVTDATEQAENAAQSAQDAADSAAMSKDWAAGQPVTYSGAPVSIAYAGTNRIASITAYGENAQGGTTEAPVALTGVDSVHVCGRNLLPNKATTGIVHGVSYTVNTDGSITAKGTATTWAPIVFTPNLSLPAGTYTLTAGALSSGTILVIARNLQSEGSIVMINGGSKTFSIAEAIENYIAFISVAPGNTVDFVCYPMLNLGSTAMPYETYQGSVAPLPIQRPLRRVGDVRDVCVTRQEYEGTEKLVVTYNVGFVELDGTESNLRFNSKYQTLEIKGITTSGDPSQDNAYGVCISSHFALVPPGTSTNLDKVVYGQPKYNQIIIHDTSWNSLETAKAYLAAQKAAGTPVQIAYQLATPEVYATDPLDIDNAAGPLTIMTGGELEVRMTELIGSRSDVSNNTVAFSEASQDADIQTGEKLSVLFGKIKKRLSLLQAKADNSLQTTVKTVIGAINEVLGRTKATKTTLNASDALSPTGNRIAYVYTQGDMKTLLAEMSSLGNFDAGRTLFVFAGDLRPSSMICFTGFIDRAPKTFFIYPNGELKTLETSITLNQTLVLNVTYK